MKNEKSLEEIVYLEYPEYYLGQIVPWNFARVEKRERIQRTVAFIASHIRKTEVEPLRETADQMAHAIEAILSAEGEEQDLSELGHKALDSYQATKEGK